MLSGWRRMSKAQPGMISDYHMTTVVAVEPNELIAELPHHRMPALLAPSEWAAWLDPATPVADLQVLLRPAPSERMEARAAGPKDFSLE